MDVASESIFGNNYTRKYANQEDSVRSIQDLNSRIKRVRDEYDVRQKKFDELVRAPQQQAPQQRVNADQAVTAGIGILGAASAAAPVLAPFAAASGVGYGVYKLGQSFSLW